MINNNLQNTKRYTAMNKSIIISILIALVIGLGLGYLFGLQNTTPNTQNPTVTARAEVTVFTCSMHPNVRQNEPGLCPLCAMDLTPLDNNSSSDDSPIRLEMTEEAIKISNIETTILGGNPTNSEGNSSSTNTSNIPEKEIMLTGTVKANETTTSTQTAHVGGRIEQFFVNYTGEKINKGQKIASVYSPELVAAQKELFEAKKLQGQIPVLYEAAKNKLKFWKLSPQTIQEIEQRGVIKTELPIYADASGIVTQKFINVGDHVKAGSPMFELMNLDKVWVLFDVYERDLQWVKVGNRIQFNVSAYPDKMFKARITFIDPLINPQTRVATARVEVTNSNNLLKPDMFAKGLIKVKAVSATRKSASATTKKGDKSSPLSVPKTAILWTGRESVAYVKKQDTDIPTFEFREVVLGEGLGNSYLVKSGLFAGEEVVTNGAFRIDASAQLSNKASMMNRHIKIKEEIELAPSIPNYSKETPLAFKEQLGATAAAYLQLKDQLVATDFEASQKAANTLSEAFTKIDMQLLKGDAHHYWMQQKKALNQHIQLLQKASDVATQRQQFSPVSDVLTNCVKAFGSKGPNLFVQYCPMAFDNTGGYWLSDVTQIKNPYFGDKMLQCGLVKDTIPNL